MGTKRRRSKSHIKAQKKRNQLRKLMALAMFVFVLLVIVFGVVLVVFYRYVAGFPEDQIYQNVYVGTLDLSGMTEEEAKALLNEQLVSDKTQTVSLQVGEDIVDATLEEYGVSYENLDGLVREAMNYGKEGSLWNRYFLLHELEEEKVVLSGGLSLDGKLGATLLNERAVPLTNHAENASISMSGSEFVITDGAAGQTVGIQETLAALEGYINDSWSHQSFTLEAVVKDEEPKISRKDLEQIQDELGSFSTEAGSGARLTNLQVGLEKLDGMVLMPGEQISVYEMTGPYDEEHGYVLGRAYEYGEVVESYGGGICQVSTTLYNALLYAEMEIVERYPHSMTVNYVDLSRDAAIAAGIKDFIFKNNYDTPIYIHGEISSSGQLIFKIYGKETRDPGRTVEYESEKIAEDEARTVYEEDAEAVFGTMSSTGDQQNGMSTRLWKIVKQDGQEVSREEYNTSYYVRVDKVIKVGTKSDNMEAVTALRIAIQSQDYDRIREAIYNPPQPAQEGT